MVDAVAGEEGDGDWWCVCSGGRGVRVFEDQDWRGGIAPGCVDAEGGDGGEAGEGF